MFKSRYYLVNLRYRIVIKCVDESDAYWDLHSHYSTRGLWVVVKETQTELQIECGRCFLLGGHMLKASTKTLEAAAWKVAELL